MTKFPRTVPFVAPLCQTPKDGSDQWEIRSWGAGETLEAWGRGDSIWVNAAYHSSSRHLCQRPSPMCLFFSLEAVRRVRIRLWLRSHRAPSAGDDERCRPPRGSGGPGARTVLADDEAGFGRPFALRSPSVARQWARRMVARHLPRRVGPNRNHAIERRRRHLHSLEKNRGGGG